MGVDSPSRDYQQVMEGLRRHGASAYLQDKAQLVVATALPAFPNSSNSFWLRYSEQRWHLITWAPRAYRLPESANVVEVSLECLRASATTLASLPEDLVRRFNLTPLADPEMEALLR